MSMSVDDYRERIRGAMKDAAGVLHAQAAAAKQAAERLQAEAAAMEAAVGSFDAMTGSAGRAKEDFEAGLAFFSAGRSAGRGSPLADFERGERAQDQAERERGNAFFVLEACA